MGFFGKKQKNRPEYLDTSLEQYLPTYHSLPEALKTEVAVGSTDVKRLLFKVDDEVKYSLYHVNGVVKHIHRENNTFNIMERGKHCFINDEYIKLRHVISQPETVNIADSLLYTTVEEVNSRTARVIYGGLAVRWGIEVDELLKNNRTTCATEIIDDPKLAEQIKTWRFLDLNQDELALILQGCRDGVNGALKTISLNMAEFNKSVISTTMPPGEDVAFWENSDEATRAVLNAAVNENTGEELLHEVLGYRPDILLTSLEALALDEKILLNGEEVHFTEVEDGLPTLKEIPTFNRHDEENSTEQFMDEVDNSLSSSLNDKPTFYATPLTEIKFIPVLSIVSQTADFTDVEYTTLQRNFSEVDELTDALLNVEVELANLTTQYANRSELYSEDVVERQLSALSTPEDVEEAPATVETVEVQDAANGFFFALEYLEQRRQEINDERVLLLRETAASFYDNHSERVLLRSLCLEVASAASKVKNVTLPVVNEESLIMEREELKKLDLIAGGDVDG